jgi:hypothetical protein
VQPAIAGLNSDWVTETILLTQRPSTQLIKDHDLIAGLKDAGVHGVLNL